MNHTCNKRFDNGFVTPLLVLMLIFGLTVAVAFTEFSSIASAKCLLDNKLSNIKESSCSSAVALRVKNASNPGQEVAENICQLMRENGLNESCTVWVYEAPQTDISENERLIIWMAETSIEYPYLAPGLFGSNSMSISAHIDGNYRPYSEATTWRPTKSGSGVYIFEEGSTTFSFTPITSINQDAYPKELTELYTSLLN